jgi:hypothetical protein
VDNNEDRERKDSQATIVVSDDNDKPVTWKGKGKETIAVGGDDNDDKLLPLMSSPWFLPTPTPDDEDPKTSSQNELIYRCNGVTGGLLPE